MFESDGAGALRIPEMYKTDVLASSWGVSRPSSGVRLSKGIFRKECVRCTLEAGSRESRDQEACLALPDNLPKGLSDSLRGDSSDACFGDLRRHVSQYHVISCLGDCMILKLFQSFVCCACRWWTFWGRDPSWGKGGQSKIFNKFCMSLKHWKDQFFFIDRRAIPDAMPWRHQDSSTADPPLTGVRAEDIRRLCENVINLRPVHLKMLYAVGLTTIWKHVGHHSVFKDGEGAGNVIFLKFSMAGGVRIGKGIAFATDEVIPQHTTPPLHSGSSIPKKSNHQKVVKVENERVLAAKRKAHAAKDRAVGNRTDIEGASQLKKRKKTTTLSFALSDSMADESNRSGSVTYRLVSPLNTIIPNKGELATGLILELVNQTEENTDQYLDNAEYTTEANSPLSEHSPQYQKSNRFYEDTRCARSHGVSSTSSGSYRLAFPACHPGWRRRCSLWRDAGLPEPFVLAWNLTTHSILNEVESRRDMMINLATPAVQSQQIWFSDYQSRNQLSEDHKVLLEVCLGSVGDEADLIEKLVAVEKVRDDLLDKDREKEERIKQLEADLASKTSSLAEAKAIAAGWSKGVKAACFEKEAQAFLATADGYDPSCKETFMSEFDSFFDKSYPYMEKLAESFWLALGDLQNMWLEGSGLILSGNAADASNVADAQ
uniref:Uncharacterized protein n=1 Tax=Tanacetum cinerariifolium TaxID=118510 RepID=A0A6L2K3K6_TANCI|nr:hypothetical protein [Tanacetum cinerariifolium]